MILVTRGAARGEQDLQAGDDTTNGHRRLLDARWFRLTLRLSDGGCFGDHHAFDSKSVAWVLAVSAITGLV